MNNYNFEMPYENQSNRSPQSLRSGSLHRQPSRQQFEAYGHLPTGLYTPDDHAQPRYDSNFGNMRNATVGGYGNGYDLGGGTWNAGAFGQNHTLGGGMGGTNGMRRPQSKGRSGLPSVCDLMCFYRILVTD
jgi:hypothetical protein